MPSDPLFHIVLHAPEIPQNTGNIGRIACCTECRLHLVKPISFSFDDAHLKRAGWTTGGTWTASSTRISNPC